MNFCAVFHWLVFQDHLFKINLLYRTFQLIECSRYWSNKRLALFDPNFILEYKSQPTFPEKTNTVTKRNISSKFHTFIFCALQPCTYTLGMMQNVWSVCKHWNGLQLNIYNCWKCWSVLPRVEQKYEEIEYNRPFHDNCGPTFIRDIFEWNNDEFAEKSLRHQHI